MSEHAASERQLEHAFNLLQRKGYPMSSAQMMVNEVESSAQAASDLIRKLLSGEMPNAVVVCIACLEVHALNSDGLCNSCQKMNDTEGVLLALLNN